MQENIEKLKKEFYKIQCKNWIPSKGHGSGAAGRTFEELLGVEENSDELLKYIKRILSFMSVMLRKKEEKIDSN